MWNFKGYADNIALQDEFGAKLTYRELEEQGKKLARAIESRCLVFSLCSNTLASVLGYTAFLQEHIVPLLLSAHIDCELYQVLEETYRPSYVWLPKESEILDFILEQGKIIYEELGYFLVKKNSVPKTKLYGELALLLTTSGSTGSPKLVRQSYKCIRANTEQIAEYLQLDDTERPVTTLPMNYTYGLSIINSHLWVGATILLTDKTIIQKEFWGMVKEQKCTSFGGVPYTYEMLDKLKFYQMDLPDLRYMTQAGGKLLPALHRKFAEYAQEKQKKFIVMYGQCEATARMGYLPPEYSLKKQGAMGIAIPKGELRIVNVKGEEITEAGVPGELIYRGENVTLGYAKSREDLVKGDEFCGELHTGDIAERDKDGFFYIVGRMKRFLKIFGNRVNLDEIDRLVKNHFNGMECASCGIDDKMYIFITAEEKRDEVRKYISEKTGLNFIAIQVAAIDAIPKNDSGKVLYKELEKYYQDKMGRKCRGRYEG